MLHVEIKDIKKPKLTLRVNGDHAIKLPPSLPAERKEQLIAFAEFIISIADVKQTLRGQFEKSGIMLHSGNNTKAKMYYFQENGWVTDYSTKN